MQTDRPHVSVLIEEAMHHEDHQVVSVSRGYSLPSRWAYMLQEYGACSGMFRLPTAGCTTIVEVPIDWGTVEALPTLSEMRGVGSASTRTTSGEGDSTTTTTQTGASLTWTWNADAAQSVAPTGTRTAWTASTVIDE